MIMASREYKEKMQKLVIENQDVEVALKYVELFYKEKEKEILDKLSTCTDLINLQAEYKAYVEFLTYLRAQAKRVQQAKNQLVG